MEWTDSFFETVRASAHIYAYQPWLVYSAVILILTASSFGLPLPEEITLVTAGSLAHIGMNPQAFPPPHPGATPVHHITLAIVCFLAVFASDFLVYSIGRYGGERLRKSPRFKKFVEGQVFQKVEKLTQEHGAWMAGVFRFTPGLRFPGHLTCGMMGVTPWQFILVDGTAALLSVPSQVLLLAYYGDVIMDQFKRFQIGIMILGAIAVAIYIYRKRAKRASAV